MKELSEGKRRLKTVSVDRFLMVLMWVSTTFNLNDKQSYFFLYVVLLDTPKHQSPAICFEFRKSEHISPKHLLHQKMRPNVDTFSVPFRHLFVELFTADLPLSSLGPISTLMITFSYMLCYVMSL